ncbi:MAG TPA: hypothetical protein VFL17_05935 [Anaerolineae bacterium]|nr:hypothetical protein [Anaerolineae bacterium]
MGFTRLRRITPAAASLALAVTMLSLLFLISSPVTHAMEDVPALPEASTVHEPGLESSLQQTATNTYTAYLPLLLKPAFLYLPLLFYNRAFAYDYGFEDPGCDGWVIHYFDPYEPDPPGPWTSFCGKEKFDRYYGDNGVYSFKTSAAWNTWIYTAPIVLADTRNFTIELDGKSAQDFMWASAWGVYFNANADRTKFYSIQIHQTGVPDLDTPPQYSIRRWINFRGTGTDQNDILVFRRCGPCAQPDFQWNTVIVRRTGDWVTFYAGDKSNPLSLQKPLRVLYLPDYTSAEYNGMGVLQGNFEFQNWNGDDPAFQVDNFYADPVYRR